MAWRPFVFAVALCAVSACASLTAEAPLFSTADQVGPPPLTEGIWIMVGDDCAASNARRTRGRFPNDCGPSEIRRQPDGSWLMVFRRDLMFSPNRDDADDLPDAMAMLIVPVQPPAQADAYASLYLVEYRRYDPAANEPGPVSYAVFAGVGGYPATRLFLMGEIGCESILRDAPIEGIEPIYGTRVDADGVEHREMRSCVASTQAAVREAATREIIASLAHIDDSRLVYVRPR